MSKISGWLVAGLATLAAVIHFSAHEIAKILQFDSTQAVYFVSFVVWVIAFGLLMYRR